MSNKHTFSFISFVKDTALQGFANSHRSPSILIYTNGRSTYPELILFKQQIKTYQNGPYYQPYTSKKSSVILYRTIFFGLGILYLLLGCILFFKSLTWSCGFLFGDCSLVKFLVCSFCGISSIAFIFFGYLIHAEKEAVKHLFRKAKKRMKNAYAQKLVEFNVNRFFLFGQAYRKVLAFQQLYRDFLEKLQECKEETLFLLDRIARTHSLDRCMKEQLFNQALLEFNDKINLAICNFQSTNPPKCILDLCRT